MNQAGPTIVDGVHEVGWSGGPPRLDVEAVTERRAGNPRLDLANLLVEPKLGRIRWVCREEQDRGRGPHGLRLLGAHRTLLTATHSAALSRSLVTRTRPVRRSSMSPVLRRRSFWRLSSSESTRSTIVS